ncbi:glycosyltransferase family 2 protein [Candidatus Microgenomates bacterium]|nr:glycosyltransferase family 2 protein [Candidatus Microgenomates bacterium]
MAKRQSFSFVIPAKNEEESVTILYKEIITSLRGLYNPFEIIFVDDGSTDQTFTKLVQIRKFDKRVKIIQLRGNFGKSIALQVGFDHAKGNLIFTMDADLQDNPADIKLFLDKIGQDYDLVSGWKKKRLDPNLSKVIPSRIINFLTRFLTHVQLHDINCGFKAYKKEAIQSINLYGELYRFIPILAAKQNFRVGEVVVSHRQRKYGKTKFGWERGIKGILDLVTIVFLTGYVQRPSHFFGGLGLGSFFVGFVIGAYILWLRITTGSIQYRHPLLFLGMLLMIIGVQLISTGLLAETIVYTKSKLDYTSKIKKILF